MSFQGYHLPSSQTPQQQTQPHLSNGTRSLAMQAGRSSNQHLNLVDTSRNFERSASVGVGSNPPDTPRTPPPAVSEEYPSLPPLAYEPPAANIYSAVYSGVPVYEMMSRGVAVMRRRADSFLNATQILKVAGLEKGKRTKILEREILQGEHEKVQGGYGKYQGTWVPFERGRELAEQYGVDHYLRPLFLYDTGSGGGLADKTPTKEQAMAAQRKEAAAARATGTGSPASGNFQPQRKRQRLNVSPPLPAQNAQFVPAIPSPRYSTNAAPPSIPSMPSAATPQSNGSYNIPAPPEPTGAEKHRSVLMAIFLNEDPNHVPELLSNPNPPADLDIDLVIDDQGHTALHWAAALARINILNHLIDKGADINRVNYMGESALDRAVLVTNNYDIQSFPELLHLLHTSIKVTDKKNRSVLHHIALTAGIKGRAPAARYYMECLLEWIARHDGDFKNIVDIQDKNGDTALNIAARVGNQSLIDQLVEVGASRLIENKVGLKPEDFGVEERGSGSGGTASFELGDVDMLPEIPEENSGNGMNVNGFKKSEGSDNVVVPGKRGRELIEAVEKIVNDVECDYESELSKKKEELFKSQQDLRTTTRELAMLRRQITSLRTKHDHLAEANQRVVNLEQALNEETALAQSLASAGGEIQLARGDNDSSIPLTNEDADAIMDVPETATDDALDSEIHSLQSRINAYTRNDADLRSQIFKLQNHAAERELQCKRLIATCCNVPLDRVDELLDPLMQAVDADGSDIDLARVAGFMSRVKQQEGWEMHNRG